MTRRDHPSRGAEAETSTVGDEAQILRTVERSFALWAMGIELMRATLDDWAQRRQQHLQEAMKALSGVEELPSEEEKATAVSNVVFDQVQNIFKDLGAAGYRAMTYQGTLARRFGEEIKEDIVAGMSVPPSPSPSPRPRPKDRSKDDAPTTID